MQKTENKKKNKKVIQDHRKLNFKVKERRIYFLSPFILKKN